MGLRGPQPRPDSTRSLMASGGVVVEPIQEDVRPPSWLAKPARRLFARLVDQNRRAGVSIRVVDAEQYADLAEAMIRHQEATDNREWLAIGRRIDELRSQLNIGPRNRARAGVRDTRKPAEKSLTAKVLELAKAKQA